MLVEALIFITFFIFIASLFHRKPKNLPPGEWGYPIIGYIPDFGERASDTIKRLQAKHGKISSVKVGSRLVVLLSEYSTIKSAFSKAEFSDRPDFFTLKIFYNFRNAGLTSTNGLLWSTNRKFATRVLTHLGMGKSKLEETINVEVNSLIKDLKAVVNKRIKIDCNLAIAVLNIIWGLAADKRFNQNDKDNHKFTKMLDENFAIICGTAAIFDLYPWLIPILPRFLLNITKVNILESNQDFLMNYVEEIIIEHIEKFDRNHLQDYIDMYLMEMDVKKGDPSSMTDEDLFQLKSSLLDLFATGSETIITSIRWYLLYMAKHPAIQEKIQKEIHVKVPHDRLPSLEDKDNLPYLEASIYESLRMASLALIGFPHVTTEDVQLEGYNIPKETIVLSSIENCHHNAAYWERPNEFYPEHFIDENGKFYIRQEGFLPFSQGRRKCFGEPLAKMELFLFIGAIVQNFTICEPEGQELCLNPNPSLHLMNIPMPYEVVLKENF